ncbi:aspartic proteinase PCS1-like [Panicum miliaceum]|uniref:Aspartic proteinase PCS1-like n=1 Tax=Panicum miliaceum TaxID=4540 RepID=A0A3L6T092_PANMI|nr:aspartic proteinase PCS1-like [Panicum miliaceum]
MGVGGSNGTDFSEAARGLLGMNRGQPTATRPFTYCIAPGDGPGLLVLAPPLNYTLLIEIPTSPFPQLLPYLGGDGLALAPPLNYTPLIEIPQPLPYFDRVAYSVQSEGIRVGAALLPIPRSVLAPDHTGAGQTMVDSGTQLTFLLADAYEVFKAEFASRTRALLVPLGKPGFVFQGVFEACFRAPEVRVAAAPGGGPRPARRGGGGRRGEAPVQGARGAARGGRRRRGVVPDGRELGHGGHVGVRDRALPAAECLGGVRPPERLRQVRASALRPHHPATRQRYTAENSVEHGAPRNTEHPELRQPLAFEVWQPIKEHLDPSEKITTLSNGPLTNFSNILLSDRNASSVIEVLSEGF